jgi:hypothetical protein
MPFGIVSIVYAVQVNSKLAAGDVAGARAAASNAKTWFWIAFGLGLTVAIFYFWLTVVAGVLGALDAQNNGNF